LKDLTFQTAMISKNSLNALVTFLTFILWTFQVVRSCHHCLSHLVICQSWSISIYHIV
jgi:hypothetical protein